MKLDVEDIRQKTFHLFFSDAWIFRLGILSYKTEQQIEKLI